MSTERKELSPAELREHIAVDLSPAKMNRQWLAIRDACAGGAKRDARVLKTLPWALAVGGAVLAVALLLLLPEGQPQTASLEAQKSAGELSVLRRGVLESRGEALGVALNDGSRVRLEPRTRIEVDESASKGVHLRLPRGKARFEVVKQRDGQFVVTTQGVEVRVVGTVFSVSTETNAARVSVSVAVEHGIVEVSEAGKTHRLTAGQSWTSLRELKPEPETAEPGEPSAAEQPSKARTRAAPKAAAEKDVQVSAKELFESANSARSAGNVTAAAKAYQTLLQRFPGDQRAGLAAFELGRLQMDRLGDFAGAVRSLERAIRLTPGSSFAEDAMARLVRAYDAMGQSAQCRRARSAYGRAFPNGVHAAALSGRCDDKL